MANQQELQEIVTKIFKLNKKIRFVAVISDSGKIFLSMMKEDKHSLLKKENEEKFCRDVVKRKKMRLEFNKSLGKVRYVHVEREKVTQFVIYTARKTIFFTMEPELTIQRKMKIVNRIKRITTNL